MKEAKKNEVIFFLLGLIMVIFGIYSNYRKIISGEFPDSIMIVFVGFNFIMMSYLSKHLFPRDERAEKIVGESMKINYFTLFLTLAILFILTLSFFPVSLDSVQTLIVIFCVMAVSIPFTMIVYSWKI